MNASKQFSLQEYQEMFNTPLDFNSINVNESAKEQKEKICDLLSIAIKSQKSIEKFISDFPQSLFNSIPLETIVKGFLLGAILFDNGDKQKVDFFTQKDSHSIYDSALNLLHVFLEKRGVDIKENLKSIADIVIKKHPDMYFHYKDNYQLPLEMEQLFFFTSSITFKYALDSIKKEGSENVNIKNQEGQNLFHAVLQHSNLNNLISLLAFLEKTGNKNLCEHLLNEKDNSGNIPLMTLMIDIHGTDKHLSGHMNNNSQVKVIEIFEFFKKNELPINIYHENKEGKSIQSLYSELLNQDILKEELGKIFVECEKAKLTGLILANPSSQTQKNNLRI